jgi:alpha-galactosidase
LGKETMPFVPADIALSREPVTLPNGVTTYTYTASFAADPDLVLDVVFRVAPDNPVVRFQYRLTGAPGRTLTKASGDHNTAYLGLSLDDFPTCKEVRVSEFDEAIHSFRPTERPVPLRAFAHALTLMGPIVIAQDDEHALLVAYEHGSQVPDAFLQYHLAPDRTMTLQAVKGNYYDGQMFDDDDAYETLWFQFAVVAGDEAALAQQYRAFVLRYMTRNAESRQPYIFYNTWNYQERNRWWNGQTFLASMHQDRILAEIDVAHRMGIEVFVIDTGWYEKTGDWQVDRDRFPDALATVKERLDAYDMKLGLWFSPRKAAVSSRIVQEHEDCRMMWQGEVSAPRPVWETEASFDMCLVSRYWEAFADQLIRLVEELGVTYFKWDAIHQYGCDAPHHFHGTEANTPQERADCYAFELGRYMTRIVDRVCAACPEAIVDFDITEGHRSVGLGFLSAGKYFLINNGPYYRSLDDPQYAPGGGMGANVFVFPGPARARLCRKPLDYDKWIPSVLFLTHYLPDDPASSQMINLASLMLGQNGIWGDLLKVSDEGVARFAKVLGLYKQVREDVTRSTPVRTGIVGGSPEIHEKIADETGRGLVAVFAEAAGTYTYITAHRVVDTHWATEGISVARDAAGRARLDVTFKEPGAHIVFFGVT